MTPPLGMIAVDPSRLGGGAAPQRHTFGFSSPPPTAPEPRKALAQAEPPAPPPSAAIDLPIDVSASVRAIVEVLSTEAAIAAEEMSVLTPEALRANPGAARAIPDVGSALNPQQLRTQVILDARALSALVSRVLTGSLSGYLDDEERAFLENVSGELDAVARSAESYDLQPIPSGLVGLSDRHVESHAAAARGMVERAERALVAAEAGTVPVREPAEKAGTVLALLAVGAVAAAVWAMMEG